MRLFISRRQRGWVVRSGNESGRRVEERGCQSTRAAVGRKMDGGRQVFGVKSGDIGQPVQQSRSQEKYKVNHH